MKRPPCSPDDRHGLAYDNQVKVPDARKKQRDKRIDSHFLDVGRRSRLDLHFMATNGCVLVVAAGARRSGSRLDDELNASWQCLFAVPMWPIMSVTLATVRRASNRDCLPPKQYTHCALKQAVP